MTKFHLAPEVAAWLGESKVPRAATELPDEPPAGDPHPEPGWDAYEHQPVPLAEQRRHRRPRPIDVEHGAIQVGLVNATADVAPCACGTDIVITHRHRDEDIEAAIVAHQATRAHQLWRKRQGRR